jgi:hypothetical protein
MAKRSTRPGGIGLTPENQPSSPDLQARSRGVPPQTRFSSLAKPSQAKPSQAKPIFTPRLFSSQVCFQTKPECRFKRAIAFEYLIKNAYEISVMCCDFAKHAVIYRNNVIWLAGDGDQRTIGNNGCCCPRRYRGGRRPMVAV